MALIQTTGVNTSSNFSWGRV